ncbi:kallikrein 1-related peptidase b9-like [Oncorhynchus kisutch]|uniref:Kallikrein 1-related peptidase b9-like n=1 Tax=Oncorhynchus kisutch TaxID=8019 RepID=A0A8C7DBW5_ONCKI|nr:kallikrein 1-related peptidase b9-like [Oncorhynchus kisutch]
MSAHRLNQAGSKDIRSIKVKLGVHNVQQEQGQERLVKQAFLHPNYDEEYNNDIMLLKLEEIAVFTDHVRPIGLPLTKDEEVPKDCLVSGWGHTIRNVKQGSPVLQDLNVTLDENQLCSDNHQVCSSGLNGPAQGDSGDPLVCNGVAYGVVSTKTRNNTYIYMHIPDFLD